jgi:hypothetical protein
MPEHDGNSRSSEANRYRQAAVDALAMLDWCIGYLAAINRETIATRIERTRVRVREQLGEPGAPLLPTGKQ